MSERSVRTLKINEVEALAGVTKKNIRFYEEQGLLSPRRNQDNGYRDYGDEEVRILRQIRLLRKLGMPIEEIRLLRTGTHTVGDGMRRHLISLEREQRNLEQSIFLCRELQNQEIPLAALDENTLLAQMEEMEQGGTQFKNKQSQDVHIQYRGPVLAAGLMLLLMATLIGLTLWGYLHDPKDAPPIWFIGIVICILAAVAGGILLALNQRIREIDQGEMDDAKYY